MNNKERGEITMRDNEGVVLEEKGGTRSISREWILHGRLRMKEESEGKTEEEASEKNWGWMRK